MPSTRPRVRSRSTSASTPACRRSATTSSVGCDRPPADDQSQLDEHREPQDQRHRRRLELLHAAGITEMTASASTALHLPDLARESAPSSVRPLEENVGQLSMVTARLGLPASSTRQSPTSVTGPAPFKLNWQVNYLGKIEDTLGGLTMQDLDKLTRSRAKIYNDMRRSSWTVEEGRNCRVLHRRGQRCLTSSRRSCRSGFASRLTGTETAAGTTMRSVAHFYAGVNIKF